MTFPKQFVCADLRGFQVFRRQKRPARSAAGDRFFDSVFAYVYRQVGSAADAEDITSGVFLEVLEKIDGFSGEDVSGIEALAAGVSDRYEIVLRKLNEKSGVEDLFTPVARDAASDPVSGTNRPRMIVSRVDVVDRPHELWASHIAEDPRSDGPAHEPPPAAAEGDPDYGDAGGDRSTQPEADSTREREAGPASGPGGPHEKGNAAGVTAAPGKKTSGSAGNREI